MKHLQLRTFNKQAIKKMGAEAEVGVLYGTTGVSMSSTQTHNNDSKETI